MALGSAFTTGGYRMGIASGGGGGDWPNKPSGFETIIDSDIIALPSADGWETQGATVVTDATAPMSPTDKVVEWFYPLNFAAGGSPGQIYQADVTGATHETIEHYAGFWFKFSNPYSQEATGTKMWYPFNPTCDYFLLYANAGGLRWGVQVPLDQGGTYWLDPNINDVQVVRGQWHRFEHYFKGSSGDLVADGIMRWWIDGTLAGDHTDVMWKISDFVTFHEWRYNPTWGGTVGTVAFDSYQWVDHIIVARAA